MNNLYLNPPRWPGGPEICDFTNLPAFESETTFIEWHEAPKRGNPLYEPSSVVRKWKCDKCDGWHFVTKPRPPSGSSSGTGREA